MSVIHQDRTCDIVDFSHRSVERQKLHPEDRRVELLHDTTSARPDRPWTKHQTPGLASNAGFWWCLWLILSEEQHDAEHKTIKLIESIKGSDRLLTEMISIIDCHRRWIATFKLDGRKHFCQRFDRSNFGEDSTIDGQSCPSIFDFINDRLTIFTLNVDFTLINVIEC
jgi:hypothetical protein